MAVVRERGAMIAGMNPALDETVWHFCSGVDVDRSGALAVFEEDEGCSLVLPDGLARERGFGTDQPMARITLMVQSALDGVGLTAAVARALAEAGIACNMMAAFHHDHAFVPGEDRHAALEILKALAASENAA